LTTPPFLVDANLSPKLADFLVAEFGFDVESLRTLGLGHLPDVDVVELAKQQGRVIITLDDDFGEIYFRRERGNIGVIYLKVQDQANSVVTRVIERFFRTMDAEIDLARSLVVITEHRVRVVRP
jgi:predicted nuclease of predicted toxin-antitoxin system